MARSYPSCHFWSGSPPKSLGFAERQRHRGKDGQMAEQPRGLGLASSGHPSRAKAQQPCQSSPSAMMTPRARKACLQTALHLGLSTSAWSRWRRRAEDCEVQPYRCQLEQLSQGQHGHWPRAHPHQRLCPSVEQLSTRSQQNDWSYLMAVELRLGSGQEQLGVVAPSSAESDFVPAAVWLSPSVRLLAQRAPSVWLQLRGC